jgi:hypothetical protein
MLVFVPFFVAALYTGQRPLHVREITGDLYNIRFGLVTLLPVALFTGYLFVALGDWLGRTTTGTVFWPGRIVRPRAGLLPAGRPTHSFAVPTVAAAVAALVVVGTLITGGVLTLDEPLHWSRGRAALAPAAAAFSSDYDGGRVLMEGFGNEYVAFASRVPSSETIYEGSYQLWQPALADPIHRDIKWIYLSRNSTDLVWAALRTSPELADYRIRFDDGTRVIYERR